MINKAITRSAEQLPRALGMGLLIGGLLVWSGVSRAATPPASFSGLAKQVTPAVVNIASTHEMSGNGESMPGLPFQFPPGSPFEKFFEPFKQHRQQGEHGNHGGPKPHAISVGSGFIIDPAGYVVTNNHVVKDADKIKVRLEDDSVYQAKLIGTDPLTDLALLKIDAGHDLPSVSFGDSDRAEVGDWVLAVGNPFGLGGTVTAGIVSARGRNIHSGPYDDFLQIDAPINRGNSGGPLFTLDGKVVGINTAIYSPNGGSVGIGFAIPSNLAKSVIAQLRDHGKVERGWLGVSIQNVTPEIAGSLGLDSPDGAIIATVMPDSPAQKGGLKQGDVILSVDGHKVADSRSLARLVAQRPANSKLTLMVWRDQRKTEVTVIAGEHPAPEQMASANSTTPNESGNGAFHSKALAADLAALTPTRRAQLDIPEEVSGIVVLHLEDGPAAEQGLREGDVIKRVGTHAVETPGELENLIKKAGSGPKKSVLLLVNRNGRDLFLGLKLGVA